MRTVDGGEALERQGGGTDVVARSRRGVGPHDEPGTGDAAAKGEAHNAEILRAGAGAPRGLRRRDHNAEVERTHGERTGVSPATITGAPRGPAAAPFPPTFRNVFIDMFVT